MKYILAFDQGTTSSRAIAFDRDGRIVAKAQQEFPQIYPKPGWVEHDPMAIWNSQLAVAKEVVAKVNVENIAAIGITNQRETTIVWDRKTGQPIHNAIVWQCRRTATVCEELKAAGHADEIRALSGLVVDAYFSGTKVAWILDNVPGARARAENGELAFGTCDSWLIWQLTGGAIHATDPSNASRTMLYNIHSGQWDDRLLNLLRVPRAVLPEVRPSSGSYGEVKAAWFGETLPISGNAGDQQAATFGQACYEPGQVKNTYGTGCFMLMNIGTKPVASAGGLLTTVGWQLDGQTHYALEGSVFIAGAVIQWLRDEMALIKDATETAEIAASINDNGGVYFVPAFVGLGAPYWDSFARGTVVGLTRGTGRAHMVRAALESIAYQTRDVVDVMTKDAGLQLSSLRVDGGATANDWLMQFQADILGVPVQRPAVTETTALGAAYLAGLAVHYWESPQQIASQWALAKAFTPRLNDSEREALYGDWRRAVAQAKGWLKP
jgi:glycerol kinase